MIEAMAFRVGSRKYRYFFVPRRTVASERKDFWKLLMGEWEYIYNRVLPLKEVSQNRYNDLISLESATFKDLKNNPELKTQTSQRMRRILESSLQGDQ